MSLRSLTRATPKVKPPAMARISRFRRFRPWLFIAAAATLSTAVAAQVRLAVVDTQRAALETEDGLRATANLKKVFEQKQKELDQRQNELQTERGDIEKQRGVLSKEAFAKRADKWQRDAMQVQQNFMQYQQDLNKKQAELTQPIFQKAMGIIRRIATQDGYDVIVDKQAVPYFRSDLDLTDRVITIYNSGGDLPSKSAPKKQAPSASGKAP